MFHLLSLKGQIMKVFDKVMIVLLFMTGVFTVFFRFPPFVLAGPYEGYLNFTWHLLFFYVGIKSVYQFMETIFTRKTE